MISSESNDKKTKMDHIRITLLVLPQKKIKEKQIRYGSTYKIINSQIKRTMKKAKEDWVIRKCKEIYTYFTHNNTKKAYQIVKDLTKPKQRTSTNIQNKYGN